MRLPRRPPATRPRLQASTASTTDSAGPQPNQTTARAQVDVPVTAQDGGRSSQGGARGQGNPDQDAGAPSQTPTAAGDQSSSAAGMTEPAFTAALHDTSQSATPAALVRQNVSLQELVETVKATFTTASQSGLSSARISLSPASLGNIQISLTQTSQGLVAHVAADHPDAVQTLQQNAADLRRSLESSGMSLLQLDIGTSGEQRTGPDRDPGARRSATGTGTQALAGMDGVEAEDEDAAASTLRIALTGGSLVDVLA